MSASRSPSKLPFSPRKSGRFTSSGTLTKTMEQRNLKKFPRFPGNNNITELKVCNNPIESFEGMQVMYKLESLRIDGTKIKSFVGAVEQPNLKVIYLSNTLLSRYHYVRVMARIVFGDSLNCVGSRPLSSQEKLIASRYKDSIRGFLLKGWILTSVNPIKLFNPATRERKTVFVQKDFMKIPTIFEPPDVDFEDPYATRKRSESNSPKQSPRPKSTSSSSSSQHIQENNEVFNEEENIAPEYYQEEEAVHENLIEESVNEVPVDQDYVEPQNQEEEEQIIQQEEQPIYQEEEQIFQPEEHPFNEEEEQAIIQEEIIPQEEAPQEPAPPEEQPQEQVPPEEQQQEQVLPEEQESPQNPVSPAEPQTDALSRNNFDDEDTPSNSSDDIGLGDDTDTSDEEDSNLFS